MTDPAKEEEGEQQRTTTTVPEEEGSGMNNSETAIAACVSMLSGQLGAARSSSFADSGSEDGGGGEDELFDDLNFKDITDNNTGGGDDDSIATALDDRETKLNARRSQGGAEAIAGTAVFTPREDDPGFAVIDVDADGAGGRNAGAAAADAASGAGVVGLKGSTGDLEWGNKINNGAGSDNKSLDGKTASVGGSSMDEEDDGVGVAVVVGDHQRRGVVQGFAVAVGVVVEDAICRLRGGTGSADGRPDLQRAVEYDPHTSGKPISSDSRRGRHPHRQWVVVAALLTIVAVALGVGLGAYYGVSKHQQRSDGPSTSNRDSEAIQTRIERLVGKERLEDPESPYLKALKWITHDDKMQLQPDSSSFVQRYIAAYFYYATTRDGIWTCCNPPSEDDPIMSDSNGVFDEETFCVSKALVDEIPVDYDMYKHVPSHRWLSKITECEWMGVICDEEGQIMGLDFPGASLSGAFPDGIVYWPFLQSIIFTANSLDGPLPSDLSALEHLSILHLGSNKFTGELPQQDSWWLSLSNSLQDVDFSNNTLRGPIPSGLWSSSNLQRAVLSNNAITGSLPTRIGNLHDIKLLSINNNELSGTIPSEVGLLENIAVFKLSNNHLQGEIPWGSMNWEYVEYLELHGNKLEGTLSDNIGNLTSLRSLDLSGNPSLSGPIPDLLFALWDLNLLDLYDCSFAGTISSFLGFLDNLYSLRISNNKFYGSIPSELALLSSLEIVWLQGNDFTGTVPEIASKYKGKHYNPTDVKADCLPNDEGIQELSCSTCTACCNDERTICEPTE